MKLENTHIIKGCLVADEAECIKVGAFPPADKELEDLYLKLKFIDRAIADVDSMLTIRSALANGNTLSGKSRADHLYLKTLCEIKSDVKHEYKRLMCACANNGHGSVTSVSCNLGEVIKYTYCMTCGRVISVSYTDAD